MDGIRAGHFSDEARWTRKSLAAAAGAGGSNHCTHISTNQRRHTHPGLPVFFSKKNMRERGTTGSKPCLFRIPVFPINRRLI